MCSNLREELDWVESMDNIVISVLSDAVDRLIVKLLKRSKCDPFIAFARVASKKFSTRYNPNNTVLLVVHSSIVPRPKLFRVPLGASFTRTYNNQTHSEAPL